jgi:hypothetical protein
MFTSYANKYVRSLKDVPELINLCPFCVIVDIKVHIFEYQFYIYFKFIALKMEGEELNREVLNYVIFLNSHIMSCGLKIFFAVLFRMV